MINKINKILFLQIIYLSLTKLITSENTLKILEDWDEYVISMDGLFFQCPKCIPYKLKSNNGTISISIPRIYNDNYIINATANVTFISLRTEFANDHYWVAWPFEEYVAAKEKHRNFPYRIFSVMGFDIDKKQNYYLLDQGIINQTDHTIQYNTSKLVIFNKNGKLLKVYYFEDSDYIYSFLTDIIVDQSMKYAYITDSGILLNKYSTPRLIVIDLENDKIYKILSNDKNFKPDEDINIVYSKNEVYNYFTNITGLNNIKISCDGEKIYFSSLKSKKIYKVIKKDILEAIKQYEKTKNNKYLRDIKITVGDKGIISQSFYFSSKNNIYMSNGDIGSIQLSFSVSDDLMHYNFKDFIEIKPEKLMMNWPSSIDLDKNKLYVLDNHYYDRYPRNKSKPNDTDDELYLLNNIKNDLDNETDNDTIKIGTYVIYTTKLQNGELSYKDGCNLEKYEFIKGSKYYLIILGIAFLIILLIVISVMCINREKHKKINEFKEEDNDDDENVNELNKKLNDVE